VLWESGPPAGGYKRRWDVETARKIVDDRFPTLISSRAVIESLRADTAIDGPIREIALRIAAARGDNPHQLSGKSWSVVIAAGKDPVAYERALRQAEVADQVQPASGLHLSVLGVPRYRMAEYDQALQTLRRAEQALQGTVGHSHAANLAFIALSLHQLDQIDEARIALDRLRGFLRNPPRAPRIYAAPAWSGAVASPTFLLEAEALIGSFKRAPR
jgi:tetratricopeptide (TPR) repeat protein